MQSEELFNRKLKTLNGSMGPPASSSGSAQGKSSSDGGGGGGKTNGTTPAMPKMGVRARATDWPPKKDSWDGRLGPNYESVIMAFQNGQPPPMDQLMDLSEMEEGPPLDDHYPLDTTKYTLSDLLAHSSPFKGLHPIRQRSNSDVTISDIDSEDMVVDQKAVNPNTGASLHREYGSTSSIDRQGLSAALAAGEGFFTLLRGYRVDTLDHHHRGGGGGMPQLGFPPELLRYDTALSPSSLQTAAQIARGEIVRISNYDYVDSSLLYSREREKSFMRRLRSSDGSSSSATTTETTTSLFRKLRTIRSDDGLRLSLEERPYSYQKCFAHYDVQSLLFSVGEAQAGRASLAQRKNTTTGASAASQYQVSGGGGGGGPGGGGMMGLGLGGGGGGGGGGGPGLGAVACTGMSTLGSFESPLGSREDLNPKENLDADEGDGKGNGLVLTCPHFRNEVGGEGERRISLSRANSATYSVGGGESCSFESSLSSHCTNAGVSVLEVPRENQPIHREKVKRYIIEHIDLGAYYYHKYFYGRGKAS